MQQVCQHRGLRERHMGVLQGFTYTEAPHAQPEAWAALQSDDTRTRVPGGESLDELRERLTAAVLDVAHNHPGVCGDQEVLWLLVWGRQALLDAQYRGLAQRVTEVLSSTS